MYANTVILFTCPFVFLSPWTYRYYCDRLADLGWPLFIFMNEIIGKNKVIFYGENLPQKETALVISNHLSNADWIQIFGLAYRKSQLGSIKVQVKKALQYVPAMGTALHGMGYIFLDRNWSTDEQKINSGLQSLKRKPLQPFWLLIFPEGHRMDPSKLAASLAFAKKKDLPQLKNVMLPRVKGFSSSFLQICDSLDAVYDLTLVYNKTPDYFWKLFSGAQQLECHMLVRRFPINSMPKDEQGLSEWLFKLFVEKETLLEEFKLNGRFSAAIVEDRISEPKLYNFIFGWNVLLVSSLGLTYFLYHLVM